MSGSQGMHSPVAQFEIKPLIELSFGGYDLSFTCLLYTSPSPRDGLLSRMPSSA